jgi:hypothetical protein
MKIHFDRSFDATLLQARNPNTKGKHFCGCRRVPIVQYAGVVYHILALFAEQFFFETSFFTT